MAGAARALLRDPRAAGPWGIAALLAVVAGLLIAQAPTPLVLLAAALPAGLALLLYPVPAMALVLFWVPIQYGLTRPGSGLLPWRAVFVDELGLAVLAGSLALRMVLRAEPLRRTVIDLPLLAFTLTGVLSGIVHGRASLDSAFLTAAGLRGILQYAVLFYAIVHLPLARRHARALLWLSVAMAAVQLPVSLWQLAAVWGHTHVADVAPGLVNDANGLSMFMLPWVCALAAARGLRPWLRWGLCGVFLLELLLGQGRFSILLLPVALAAVLLRGLPRPRVLAGIAVAALVGALAVGSYLSAAGLNPAQQFSLRQLYEDQTRIDRGAGRLLFYPLAWRVLREDSAFLPIGTGPGTFTSFTGYRLRPQRVRWIEDFFLQSRYGFDWAVDSQLIATGVEFGPLGLVFFFWMLWRVFRRGRQLRREASEPAQQIIAAGAMASALLLTAASIVANAWEIQYVALNLWLFAALCEREIAGRWQGPDSSEQAVV